MQTERPPQIAELALGALDNLRLERRRVLLLGTRVFDHRSTRSVLVDRVDLLGQSTCLWRGLPAFRPGLLRFLRHHLEHVFCDVGGGRASRRTVALKVLANAVGTFGALIADLAMYAVLPPGCSSRRLSNDSKSKALVGGSCTESPDLRWQDVGSDEQSKQHRPSRDPR